MNKNNNREIYANSPITEAIIDFQIDPPLKGERISEIDLLHSKLQDRYPEKRTRRVLEAQFGIKDDYPSVDPKDPIIDGYQFWSFDKKNVCQFRLEGFTFSRLKPYEKWEEHYAEAVRCWDIYRLNLRPLNFKRLAVRYINNIEIPVSEKRHVELSDYFNQSIHPATDLPQEIDGFLIRISVPFSNQIKGIITLSNQQSHSNHVLSVLLDIDVFSQIDKSCDYGDLEKDLSNLHDIAEEIFERTIKDATREIFRK